MARIRTVKPKFWDDIKLSKVSRDVRLLFIGMWNFADDCGVILSDETWLKSKIFPYDKLSPDELKNWLAALCSNDFIIQIAYKKENFYFIKNFKKHQRIDKPNNDEINIPKDCLSMCIEQSTNNPRLIDEQSEINRLSIQGGKDRIVEDRKGGEGIGKEIKINTPDDEFRGFTPKTPALSFLPKKTDFNGVPENIKTDLKKLVLSVKRIEIEDQQVEDVWDVFKNQNLTGDKPYKNDDDVYRHFINWASGKSFKKPTSKRERTNIKSYEVFGVEFVEDFSKCRMNNGTTVDLSRNESDSARYGQINPSSIKR